MLHLNPTSSSATQPPSAIESSRCRADRRCARRFRCASSLRNRPARRPRVVPSTILHARRELCRAFPFARLPTSRLNGSATSVLDQFLRFARIAAAQARDGAIARGNHEPSGNRAARWIKLRGVAPDLEEDILKNFFGGLCVAKNAIQNSAEQAGITIVEGGESGLVASYDALDQRPIGGALVCGCC